MGIIKSATSWTIIGDVYTTTKTHTDQDCSACQSIGHVLRQCLNPTCKGMLHKEQVGNAIVVSGVDKPIVLYTSFCSECGNDCFVRVPQLKGNNP